MYEPNIWRENPKIPDFEGEMNILFGDGAGQRYPMYMYLGDSRQCRDDIEMKGSDAILLVNNTDEELDARSRGYDNIHAGMIANKVLVNWYWDLEDFSPKQLVVFAKEEFDVDLPMEDTQVHLLEAVLRLTKFAPQNSNRVVLMAHTIKMNYEETLATIRKVIQGATEETVMEFVA